MVLSEDIYVSGCIGTPEMFLLVILRSERGTLWRNFEPLSLLAFSFSGPSLALF